MKKLALPVALICLVGTTSIAQVENEVDGEVRLRFEQVDVSEDAGVMDASAISARGLVRLTSTFSESFKFVGALEGVQGAGNYSDGGANDVDDRATIADPDGVEVEELYLEFTPNIENTRLIVGRHGINQGNVRYVGTVGWRQNNQSYDGATFQTKIGNNEIDVATFFNVNRIFGEDHPVKTARNYDVDAFSVYITNAANDVARLRFTLNHFDFADLPDLSTRTIGAGVSGAVGPTNGTKLLYDLEGGVQSGVGDNPSEDDTLYYRISAGLGLGQLNNAALTVNFESLGATDSAAFTTPLATLHGKNGWIDRFLATPATGLTDSYVQLKWDLEVAKVVFALHDFSSIESDDDYGTELNWSVVRSFSERVTGGVKGGYFQGEGANQDVGKLWAWVSLKF